MNIERITKLRIYCFLHYINAKKKSVVRDKIQCSKVMSNSIWFYWFEAAIENCNDEPKNNKNQNILHSVSHKSIR